MKRVIQSQAIKKVPRWPLLFLLLMPILFGCARKANIGQNNVATVSSPTTVATKAVTVTRLVALAVGHITYQHGCLSLIDLDGSRKTLVWPPDFHPVVHPDTGYVEITLPNDKKVEIRLGDQLVNLGGGNVSEPHGEEFTIVTDKSIDSELCPSPYWLVGDVTPQ
jgi:hypothetical protein